MVQYSILDRVMEAQDHLKNGASSKNQLSRGIKMKNLIFFTLFLLIPILVNAQRDSSSLIFRFNGGYADISSSNGAFSLGASASNTRDWNVALSVGIPVGKRWEVGLGFEYIKQKTVSESIIDMPIQWSAYQITETDVNLFIGKIYMAGHWQLFKRLYFNPILSAGIGKAKGTQIGATRTASYPDYIYGVLWLNKAEMSHDYFAIGLTPAFYYYITKHFALNLEAGNFRFSTTDWEWDNKQWLANINPMFWQLGIMVAF